MIMRPFIKKAIALLLAIVLFAELPMGDYNPGSKAAATENKTDVAAAAATGSSADVSEAGDYTYVSDLRLYKTSGSNRANVIAQAKAEGYTIATENDTPINLNEFTERDDILLGYKTSAKREEAITDVRMLEMDHGYEWFDYQRVAEMQMDKMDVLAADIGIAAVEFSNNLKKKSRAAEFAKDYLNYLYFTDTAKGDGPRHSLGDYLASGDVSQETIKKMLIRMNGGSLTALYSQLALGITDTDKNWIERIPETEPYKKQKITSTEAVVMDRSYYEYAIELSKLLKTFADGYRAAQNHKGSDGQVALPTVSGAAADAELSEENVQDAIDAGNTDKNAADLVYETAYEALNKYTVGSENAGDYIIRMGEKTYSSKTDYRALYPLVAALTDGQYGMMKIVGVAQMAMYLNLTEDFYKELRNMRATIRQKINTLKTGETQISVYAGVNTEFYERKVALTDDAYRQSKAGTLYTELTREGEFYDTMNMIMTYVGLAASVSSLITGCIALGIMFVGAKVTVWAVCAGAIGSGIFASIGGVLGCAAVIGGYVTLVAMIVIGIVYLVKYIVDLFKDPDKEEYTKMPEEVYDRPQVTINGENKAVFVKYLPVANSSGSPQDINADDGKRWNLLYYTKNQDLGTPLVITEDGSAFHRSVNDANTPAGAASVKCFGEKSASNLNSYTRKESASAIYLHFYTIRSIEDNGGITGIDPVNKGEEVVSANSIDKSSYLFALTIVHEKSESAAKAAITRKENYRVYDKNFSQGDGYTYIGFATTKVEKDAIRDIRLVPNYTQEMNLGSAGYALAGKFDDGTALVYTYYKTAGDPIYGGFLTETQLLPPESEFEPVNTFSGCNAYNLNFQTEDKGPLYLYFQATKSYTSGEKYLGGLTYVSVRKGAETDDIIGFLKKNKLSDFGAEIVDHQISSNRIVYRTRSTGARTSFVFKTGEYHYDPYKIRLCYNYTYNPHRAIYDVRVYTATQRVKALKPVIKGKDGHYAAVTNLIYSDVAALYGDPDYNGGTEKRPSTKPIGMVSRNNSYIYPQRSFGSNEFKNVEIEDNVSWKDSGIRLQNLYVLGAVEGKQPIKMSDIVVRYTDQGIKGMHSVKRFTDPYSKPVEISYIDGKQTRPVYMYLRGAETEKPKYISSIEVVTYKRPQSTDKHTFTEEEYKELDKEADDDCRMQLAGLVDGEVYNYNFAIPQQNAWYNNINADNSAAAYIGVNRTNSESHAITGIIMLKAKSENPEDKPAARIKVNGAEYHRTGAPVYGYYFYYTKSPGANPGLPVTDLTFDNDPIGKGGVTTVAGISAPDENGKTAEYLSSLPNVYMNIHMKTDTKDGVISDMTILKAGDRTALMTEMMKSGYNFVVDESLNRGTGGVPIYLAYKMCSAENLKKASEATTTGSSTPVAAADDEDWSDFNMDFSKVIPDEKMIRDIVCVVGGTPEKTITQNGVTYNLVSDISLNEGTSGRTIYLYSTTAEDVTIDGKKIKLSPLSRVVVCSGNAVPAKEDMSNQYGTWEELLDTKNQVVDVNDSVINKFDDFSHARDCRLYLFAHRYDQGAKPGAEIKRGEVTSTFTQGNIYLRDW